MKQATITRRALTAALTIAAAVVPAMAQTTTPGTGERTRLSRLDFLAGYLSLTDDQKTQAQAIFDAAQTATDTASGQMQAAREALTAAINANQSEAELDRLSAAIGVIHGQVTAIQAKAQAKFYALLTADQKTKYDSLKGSRGSGVGRRGARP
ncbi:MAG: Spy/CpxP family protein refolding chaperone [Bryobacteraceae bacterium]